MTLQNTLKPESWNRDVAVILGHGAGQGQNSPFMDFFRKELAQRGFLSVTFDFDYMEAGRKIPDPLPRLQSRFHDVIAEVAAVYSPRAIVIGGKSMGGRVASTIAKDAKDVRALVFLGYPLHPPGKQDQLRDAHLYDVTQPMLFLTGTRDPFAEPERLQKVIDRLGDRATLVWTEKGDHSLRVGKSGAASLDAAADVMEAWIRRVV
jgi:predicted alpha/beta-hydrolase family hydrolase